mgnify:CR=1 FL=1|jgi:hypothetical protein|tara:strand:+ start:1514 stop:5911 length:4398 start_codon:yes stop_codon:yes gene_type:complete
MAKKDRFYLFGTEEGTKGPEFNVFENIGLGVASGLLKIPEAILELGAGFVDYAADTNLVTALEENYPKINVTDGVGKFVEIALQYGVPYGAALKIGSKMGAMKKMRDLGSATKANTASRIAGKMGYYGAPAVIADSVTGSARDATLGEAFGLYSDYETQVEGKEGREKAEEVLKQKVLTGIEGGVLGGLISTAAGPAIKTTFKLGAKGASGAGKIVSPLVINPLQNILAKPAVGDLTRKTLGYIKTAKQKVAPLSIRQLKFVAENEKTLGEKFRSMLGRYLAPEGINPREVQSRLAGATDALKAIRSDLNIFLPKLSEQVKAVANTSKINLNTTGPTTLTREQAVLKDVNRVLSGDAAEGGALRLKELEKMFIDRGLKGEELENFVNAVKNVRNIRTRITKSVLAAFKEKKLNKATTKKLKSEINEAIEATLVRDSANYFAAFDKGVKYKFSGKEFEIKKKAAVEEAFQVLKARQKNLETQAKNSGKKFTKTSDEVLRENAKNQVRQLITLAENQRSEGSFFHELRIRKAIGDKEGATEKYFSTISKDMINKRFFKEGDKYSLRLKNLLGAEFAPLKGFEDKYMALGQQLGMKRYINSLVNHNKSLGEAVANRMEKIFFKPTKDAKTLMKEKGITEDLATAEVSLDLRRQVAKEYGLDIEKVPELVLTGPNKFKGTKAVEEDVFGIYDAINPQKQGGTFYTTEQIAQNLNGMREMTDTLLTMPFYRSFLMAKGGTQIGKTILSPVTQIRNFTSAAFFALHNGHFGNPFGKGEFSITDVLKTHIDELFPKGVVDQAGLQKMAQEARRKLELGVTSGSLVQGEIDDILLDIARTKSNYKTTDGLFNSVYNSKKFKALRGASEKSVQNITDFTKSTYNKANQFYSKGDDFWKDYGYRYTMSQLNEALPDITSLNPITKQNYTQKEIAELIEEAHVHLFKRRPNILKEGAERGKKFGTLGTEYKARKELMEEFAAEYVKNTYPNYSYVSQAIRELRRLPIGNFISFPAEILRTSSNLAVLTGRELSIATKNEVLNTAVRKMGSRRLLGQMAGYSSGPILATYSMKMLGMTEEQYEALRESQVAEWNQFSDLIMVGKQKDKDGNVKYKYLNFAYQNPYDYIRSPIYNFFGEYSATGKMGLDHEDRFVRSALQSVSSLFQPFIGEAIFTERSLDVLRGSTNTGKRIWDKNVDDAGDIIVRSFTHMLKGISPGVFTQAANVSEAVAKNVTPYGKQYDLSDELIALLSGVRVYEADMKNNLNFSINNHLRSIQTLKSRAGAQIFAANVTPNTVASAYKEYVEGSYKEYNEMKKILNDLELLGFEKKYINKYFKQRKVRKDIVKTLRRDRFVPPKWETFFNDQRFEKIAKDRGISRRLLFPTSTTRAIERQYRNVDLLQSLDKVRGIIKNKEKNRNERIAQRTAIQGQGTTAGGSPLNTPSAKVTGMTQPLGGLSSGNLRQRIIRDDEFLKDLA